MPTFVQLLHPGKEHGTDHGNIKEWNTGEHRRKFVKNLGSCLINNRIVDGELLFWCEWEPESVVMKITDNTIKYGPRYLHIPFISTMIFMNVFKEQTYLFLETGSIMLSAGISTGIDQPG